MKRYGIILLLVVVMIALMVGYYRLNLSGGSQQSAFDALPENTSLVLSFNSTANMRRSLDSSAYGNVLTSAGLFQKLMQDIALVDSVLLASDYMLADSKVLASVYSTEKDAYALLYLIEVSEGVGSQIFSGLKSGGKLKVKARSFRDHPIYDITLHDTAHFTFTHLNGVLIGSSVPFLVEESLLQLNEKESILTQPGLQKLISLAGTDADMSLFIKPGNLKAIDDLLLSDKASAIKLAANRLADWMMLDVFIREKDLFFTGYTSITDTSLLAGQSFASNITFDVDRGLPENTMAFVYTTFEELHNPGSIDSIGLYSYLNDIVSGRVVNAWLESFDAEYADDAFAMLPVTSNEQAEAALKELSRLSGAEAGRLLCGNQLDVLFDDLVHMPTDPYYIVIGEQVYFSENPAVLQRIEKHLENGQSLYSSMGYQRFKAQVASNSNYTIYISPSLAGEVLSGLIAPGATNALLEAFSPVVLQFTDYNGLFFTNAYVSYAGGGAADYPVATDNGAIWRVQLDTLIHGKPWFVQNHETNEDEIFVQDQVGNVYLIDKGGKLLWKRKLGGLVLGNVQQVDLYKNGKLQLIFNTEDEIYLIARNGDDVEQFPIRLPEKATSGMAVFDYEGDKNYRYFVACANYKVYGYYPSGKPLPGWSPKPRVGTIPYPMQYATSGDKDYLIMQNVDGTLLYYDRRGDRRTKPIRLKAEFNQPFEVIAVGNSFELINASISNMFFKVTPNGDVIEFELKDVPAYKGFAGLTVGDSTVYCLASEETLFTLHEDLSLAKQQSITADNLPFAINWSGAAKSHVGVVDAKSGQIYLYDSDLELVNGFPLGGVTLFSVSKGLFGGAEKVVVVGDKDGFLNAFRLN